MATPSWLPMGGPPKRRKKTIALSCESAVVPIGPRTMQFPPPSQSASASLGSGHSIRSASGSNQLESLAIEYPVQASRETTPPPTTSKPTKLKNAKGKGKAAPKKKKKSSSKKSQVPVPHDSPAMGTRSKTPQSPASHTRSKRKIPLPDLNF
ncbi:unnamed protein product [Urochloa decumbens]|uniref:Uncharacterized protein n=1 Tax=Urochloa decumbens TaxID=240449 RepID=A0ABC9HGU8_9POAL